MKFKNIVLADKDEVAIFINQRLLVNLKITENVTVTRNGKELLDYLRFCKYKGLQMPDIILLDTHLEYLALEQLLNMISPLVTNGKKRVKLILLSCLKWNDHERLMKIYKIDSLIEKPLTMSKLQEALEEMIVPNIISL